MSGMSKNRRKKGSSSRGFWGARSRMVPRVAMFTTAGETRLIMGASVGIGVSPTAWGRAAWLAKARLKAQAAVAIRSMRRGYSNDDQVSLVAPVVGVLLAIGAAGAGPVAHRLGDFHPVPPARDRGGRRVLAAARHRPVAGAGAGRRRAAGLKCSAQGAAIASRRAGYCK